MLIVDVIYFGLAFVIAMNDTFFREPKTIYTITDILLRITILLPLLFAIVKGKSRYAHVLRITLCIVMVADTLLPLFFPLGMGVFLIVHIFNSYNFSQYIEFRKQKLGSLVFPALLAYGVALALYFFVLFPHENALFKILTGVYMLVVTLAWSFSMTSYVQNKTRWALITSIGMFLFFFTDFQVAAKFLANVDFPYYGFINSFTYYTGFYLMSKPTKDIPS